MALVVHSTHQWSLSSSHEGPQNSESSTIYDRLDVARKEFRLLNLLPGKQSDPIICELQVWCCDKGQCPQYEALSYVWAGSPGPSTIILRGRHVHVTSNLESALRHLRYQDHHRTLWIDALCIKQDNLGERNDQVRQMRSIYQLASQVIVWLGPLDSKMYEKSIDHIFRFANDETLHWTMPSSEGGFFSAKAIGAGPLLFLFFNNPWWNRIWTVQEAAVAKKLTYICGQTLIPPENFVKVAKSYLSHLGKCCSSNDTSSVGWNDLEARMKKIMELEDLRDAVCKHDFLDVFRMNRYRDASNPRDMIYGLMGLTADLSEEIIQYEATIQATYERTTLEIINQSGKLDVFSQILGYSHGTDHASRVFGKGRNACDERLPSWVPDWSWKYEHTYLASASVRQKRLKLFHAGKETKAKICCIAPDRLLLEGLDLLNIRQLGETNPPITGSIGFWSSWRTMAGIDRSPDQPYVAGDTILNAF